MAIKTSAGQRGFTLLELLIAFSIAGLLLAVSVPASYKMYQSMQYREAVRDVRQALESARYTAMLQGKPTDVILTPRIKRLTYANGESRDLPEFVDLETQTAQEQMATPDAATIRFFGDGSSTGGTVKIGRNNRWVRLHVGWLLGRVEQTVDES
ncbi:type II secretion system protein [Gilvimarinus sp. 1_MG-2023]|uniref:type II secretion system protein n=1 Tax=Gilvimarinus sp. 1_MG-2023 TaxID=3062638 RepID=UPI0026E3FB50|nr:type II secretion system protein [Gilvimarinus sp. 1_MG-2023]MDO6746794.1 type II secretion system protein [Gilvimarinus sp. 1_MG-2023]